MGNHADEADANMLAEFYYALAAAGLLVNDDVGTCKREVLAFLAARREKREATFGRS